MISLKTFVLILALIEFGLLATVIVLAIIGKGKFGFASLHIVMYMILIDVVMIIGTSGNITKYSGGVEHLNIVEIKKEPLSTEGYSYNIELSNGRKYSVDNVIYGKETKLITDCQLIKPTALLFSTYTYGDLLVVKPASIEGMSESEKQYYIDSYNR